MKENIKKQQIWSNIYRIIIKKGLKSDQIKQYSSILTRLDLTVLKLTHYFIKPQIKTLNNIY